MASDICRGYVPSDLRLKSTKAGIAAGLYTEHIVRVCGMAKRLAGNREAYDKERAHRKTQDDRLTARKTRLRAEEKAAKQATKIETENAARVASEQGGSAHA